MIKKKRIVKGDVITDIDMLIRNKHRNFIIVFSKKERHLDYNKLKTLTFDTLYTTILEGRLYISVIQEYVVDRTKPVKPVSEVDVPIKSNCRTTIDDLINAK